MPLKISSIVYLGLACSFSVSAENFYGDSYRDSRMLGRGNAGIADVTGGIAAFYNPAGLAASKNVSFVPVDLTLGFNKNIYDSLSEISSLTSGNETLSQKFSPFLGKPLALQGGYFPHVAIPGGMVGFFDYMDVNIEYRDPVYPRLDLGARNDWGLIAGGAANVTPFLQVGASLRYFHRKSLNEQLDMASVFNLTGAYLQEIMRRGEGWGLNVGARMKHMLDGDKMWISAGLVVEDLGYTKLKNADRSPLPYRQAQKVNAGLGLGINTPTGPAKVLFDIKELNRPDVSMTKRIFTGVEVPIPGFIFRGGFFQGYWTLGLTTSLIPALDLDLTTYGEELGSAAGLKEARYWMLGLRMGLDAQGGKSGKRHPQKEKLDKL